MGAGELATETPIMITTHKANEASATSAVVPGGAARMIVHGATVRLRGAVAEVASVYTWRSAGSSSTQPSGPLPPRSRPALSDDATMAKTVSSVGTETIAVIAAWTKLNPAPTCGSANRW